MYNRLQFSWAWNPTGLGRHRPSNGRIRARQCLDHHQKQSRWPYGGRCLHGQSPGTQGKNSQSPFNVVVKEWFWFVDYNRFLTLGDTPHLKCFVVLCLTTKMNVLMMMYFWLRTQDSTRLCQSACAHTQALTIAALVRRAVSTAIFCPFGRDSFWDNAIASLRHPSFFLECSLHSSFICKSLAGDGFCISSNDLRPWTLTF